VPQAQALGGLQTGGGGWVETTSGGDVCCAA
jgi:hypothetical protein